MAKPRIEVQIAAEVGNALNGLKRATEAINQFKAAAGAAGGKITVSLGNAAKRAGVAAREIKTEFSDSFAEVEAAIKASGATADNWSQQFVRAANAVAPPVRRAKVVFDGLHSSLRHIPKSTSGFGILTNQTQALTRNLQRVSLAANAANQSLVGVGRQGAAAIRGGTSAAISFGHIIQDLPYGINGVANNITQLTTQMGYMAASAKAAGVSMRTALLASISNPATLAVLGVSALTSAIVFFTGRVGKAKKGTDDLKSSILSLSDAMQKGSADAAGDLTALDALYRASQDVGRSIRERTEAVDALQDKYPKYFGNLSNEAILAGEAADAYGALRANIIQAAQARAIQDQIVERTKADLALQPKRLKALEKAAEAQQKLDAFVAAYAGTSEKAKRADQGYQTQLALLTSNLEQAQREFQNLTTQSEKLRKENAEFADQLNNFTIDAITGDTSGADEAAKAAEEARKKQIADAKKAAKEIKKAEEEAFLASLTGQDEETERIRLKYAERKSMANLSKEDIIRLNNAEAQEIAASNAKWDKKRLADQAKFQEKLAELQRKSFLAGLPDEDAATERIRQQFDNIKTKTEETYNELLALANGNEEDITRLNEWYAQRRIEIANDEAAAIAKSNKEFADKREAAEAKRREAERKAHEKAMRDMANLQEEWARTLSRQLEGVLFEGENVFDALGRAFKRMVSQMIADAVAADLVKALFKGGAASVGGLLGGLFGVGKGAGLGGLFKGLGNLFKGLGNAGRRFGGVPFANGGIVSGPTLGLVGEYPGARSNPEVIAPLSDLQRYIDHAGIAGRVIVEGQISNDVIAISNQRGERKLGRYYGLGR